MDRVVICMKWGTLYGPDYVNVLFRACKDNITGPFRFVCLTDESAGFDAGVESFPIPDLGITSYDWKKGGWPKISVFQRDLYGLTGRCLFVDLDTVICGSLDDMFDYPAPFVAIDTGPTWGKSSADGKPVCGTGIFVFDLGSFPQIVDDFVADPRFRIEQLYVHDRIPDMAFWPADWVMSFKYHQRRPAPLGLIWPPRAPSPENRIIAFHGDPRPIDLVKGGLWGIAPNLGYGRVRWAVDYWTRYGGKA
jgi:hypothetical protein